MGIFWVHLAAIGCKGLTNVTIVQTNNNQWPSVLERLKGRSTDCW